MNRRKTGMKHKFLLCVLALALLAALLLAGCSPAADAPSDNGALTWCLWGGYGAHQGFFELFHETYPDIELDLLPYQGASRTGYSWAQMRADDIPDIYITSQILDESLAKERLIDLSTYAFINSFSDAALRQVEIDGGVYLLPLNYTMYGIFYNKTLMEENGWKVPANFEELELLCGEIREAGLMPGVIGTRLTGNTFEAAVNLAKTDWLTTPAGSQWERDFLAGDASAAEMWGSTVDYIQKYIDIGMLHTDPEDRDNGTLLNEYLGGRKAVFLIATATIFTTTLENGDEVGMMPYIGEDGSKNVYMYSPSCYFGLSQRLAEPGNEQKLENALKVLELLFSVEGQQSLLSEDTPCVMSALDSGFPVSPLIADAQQAMRDGRAFPMTYAHWDHILADIGQVYKEWLRGESGIDGAACIAQMDTIQQDWLSGAEHLYFCESTANFTQEETARMVAKALGSATDADAVLISLNELHEGGAENPAGVSGVQYAEKIDIDRANIIAPGKDGEYALMTMTGAEARMLAEAGFDLYGDGNPFPYILVTKGDVELADDSTYLVAFPTQGYTQQTAQAYAARVENGSIRTMLHEWLKEQGTVSPDGNPWE